MWPPGGKALTDRERMRLALEGLDRRLSAERPWLLLVEWREAVRRRAKTRATAASLKRLLARTSPSCRGS